MLLHQTLSATISSLSSVGWESVDTRVGTGGFGFGVGGVNPGVQLPFGALRLGPDTTLSTTAATPLNAGTHYGGYWYEDTHIRAFSHTHLVGAGVGDWGNLGVMPSWIGVESKAVTLDQINAAVGKHAAPFSHAEEIAKPGLYTVTLRPNAVFQNRSIRAELAAVGSHAGAHRYTWRMPSGSSSGRAAMPLLLIDACHSAEPPKSGESACTRANITLTSSSSSSRSRRHHHRGSTLSPSSLQIEGSVLQSGSLTGRSPRGGVEVFWSLSVTDPAALCPDPSARLRWGTWGGGSGAQWATGATSASSSAGLLGVFLVCSSSSGSSSVGAGDAPPQAELRVGISFISAAQARVNAAAQAPASLSFEALRNRTVATWRGELAGRVAFGTEINIINNDDDDDGSTGGSSTVTHSSLTPDLAAQLYGALYRTLLAPSTYSEVGGLYRGFDGKLHAMNETADERNPGAGAGAGGAGGGDDEPAPLFRSDMSLWDVHRSEFPLLRLLRPRVSRDIVLSLAAMARHSGPAAPIPRWPLANIYTGCMVGNHGWNVIADACMKHTDGLSAATFGAALASMARTVNGSEVNPYGGSMGRSDRVGYEERGWVASESDAHAASLTLAYAFDDWSASQLATCMASRWPAEFGANVTAWAATRRAASKRYANLWSATRELLCPRTSSGALECPTPLAAATPYPFEKHYVEGDANQYVWFVPGDPEGLVSLFSNRSSFIAKLDRFFEDGVAWGLPNTLPNPAYWAGNEPDILAPWLFTVGGAPELTQKWTRWINDHRYSSAPTGLPGNDDFGTLSAWLVWSSIGMYPQSGSTRYFLGSPRVDHFCVRSDPSGGGTSSCDVLEIVAHNVSTLNVYVDKAALGGVLLTTPFVEHHDVVRSGKLLEFWMRDTPAEGGGFR